MTFVTRVLVTLLLLIIAIVSLPEEKEGGWGEVSTTEVVLMAVPSLTLLTGYAQRITWQSQTKCYWVPRRLRAGPQHLNVILRPFAH